MSRVAERRARSIAVPIFALAIVSVLVAASVFFALILSGPPPHPPPQSVATVVAMLSGKPVGRNVSRVLLSSVQPTAPLARGWEHPDPALATHIAAALRIDPQRVAAYRDEDFVISPEIIAGNFTIAVRDDARFRVVRTVPVTTFLRWQAIVLAALLAAIVLLSTPAWLVARALSRPLRQLADTAAHARAGAPLGPVPEGGASEVRDLARAVAAMHQRLAQHAESRTTMLAAIAHDMGTPLARLAFRLELLPDEARTRALADIEEMRAMLGAALRFARDDANERADQRIDLASLLDSLAEDMAAAGAPVTLNPVTLADGERVIVRGDPAALRRMFGNLIQNAVRYGNDAAIDWAGRWTGTGGTVVVTIDDSGPGFDPELSASLFEPFVRGDPSRNRDTGGTGLGLAIVRSIAEAHRGTVTLENHAGGGRVRVVLPALHG